MTDLGQSVSPMSHVDISTNGQAKRSVARVWRKDGAVEYVGSDRVTQASCAVRHHADGSQTITATIWVKPKEGN